MYMDLLFNSHLCKIILLAMNLHCTSLCMVGLFNIHTFRTYINCSVDKKTTTISRLSLRETTAAFDHVTHVPLMPHDITCVWRIFLPKLHAIGKLFKATDGLKMVSSKLQHEDGTFSCRLSLDTCIPPVNIDTGSLGLKLLSFKQVQLAKIDLLFAAK